MRSGSYNSNKSQSIEGLDFYTPSPLSLLLAYNTICALAISANLLHLITLWAMRRQTGQRQLPINYRNFLVSLGACDLTLSVCRLVISNDAMQRLLLANRAFCVTSSVVIHSCLLIRGSSFLIVSVDRVLAVSKGLSYRKSRFVKHFNKILIMIFPSWLIMYSTIAAVFWDRGYRVKGVGACRMGSETVAPLGLISVVIMFITLIMICAVYGKLLRCFAMSLRQARQIRRVNRRNRDVIVTIGTLLIAKLLLWLPIMATVATRAMKMDCMACEWVGLITMVCNPLLNPVIYGVTNKTYGKFVKDICS